MNEPIKCKFRDYTTPGCPCTIFRNDTPCDPKNCPLLRPWDFREDIHQPVRPTKKQCGDGEPTITLAGFLFGHPEEDFEVDPCIYEVAEVYENVTVEVRKCTKCGKVDISWHKQVDTVELDVGAYENGDHIAKD